MSIRWDCTKSGCYKDKCIPDWGFLDGAFPRGIRPTDVDGAVEIDGRFLFLEWKNISSSGSGSLGTGQRIFFEQLTKLSPRITVFLLYGNTVTGEVLFAQRIHDGVFGEKKPVSAGNVYAACKEWASQ